VILPVVELMGVLFDKSLMEGRQSSTVGKERCVWYVVVRQYDWKANKKRRQNTQIPFFIAESQYKWNLSCIVTWFLQLRPISSSSSRFFLRTPNYGRHSLLLPSIITNS
jgi:hypothetical protein